MNTFASPEDALLTAGATVTPPVAEPPEYSDDAVALAFSARYAGQLLYAAKWGRWLRWDGARWAADTDLAVFDLARLSPKQTAVLVQLVERVLVATGGAP